MTYALVLIFAVTLFQDHYVVLAEFDSLAACARNAQRITEREKGSDGVYKFFKRAHCERIDR